MKQLILAIFSGVLCAALFGFVGAFFAASASVFAGKFIGGAVMFLWTCTVIPGFAHAVHAIRPQ